MADLSKTVAIVFSAVNNTGTALSGVESGLKGLGTEAGASAKGVDGLTNSVDKLGDSGGAINSAVDAMKALAAAVVVKEFIDANVEAEKFERAMTLLKGSSEAAAAEFEYVKKVSALLGTELFTTADAYVQLSAATKGTSLEGQATRDIFEAVATAMGSLGKSSADTQGALLAISQIVSKGTVSMEELRGQLGERLPGAFQIAADAMGVTTQELDDLVSSGNLAAEDFLPKFALALRDTFGDTTYVEGYAAAWNRLKNSLSEAYIELGDSGAMDVLTKGVELATAAVVGAVAAFETLGTIAGAVAGAIATGDFSGLGDAIANAMERGAQKTQGVRDALLGADAKAADLKYTAEQTTAAIETGMKAAADKTADLQKAAKEVDGALKALGIDPKQFKDPLDEVLKAFKTLSTAPGVSGDQFLSGLLVTLDKLKQGDDFGPIVEGIAKAYQSGVIGADQYTAAVQALDGKQAGLWEGMIRTTEEGNKNAEALKRQAEEARKAEESASKFALEMEKLASNERIKFIEAKVNLDIANVQANAQIAVAAFDSINTGIQSTGSLIGDLFKLLGNSNLSFADQWALQDQIESETQFRAQEFALQSRLINAQIAQMQAQTQALNSGGGLIKIDGAGLKPHLEAFMWEILKAIQVRVNSDGLKMLLGV